MFRTGLSPPMSTMIVVVAGMSTMTEKAEICFSDLSPPIL